MLIFVFADLAKLAILSEAVNPTSKDQWVPTADNDAGADGGQVSVVVCSPR